MRIPTTSPFSGVRAAAAHLRFSIHSVTLRNGGGGQSNPVNQPPSPPPASPSPSPYPTAHLHTMATTASTPGRISITPPWLGAVSVGARVLHHRCHVPFLWKMCFSGRPFLHGIQIFLSGFWVSSRGTDGVSCSMAAREPLGAAGGGLARPVRSSLGSPAEGDRCFICAAPRRDGGDPVPLRSLAWSPLSRYLYSPSRHRSRERARRESRAPVL